MPALHSQSSRRKTSASAYIASVPGVRMWPGEMALARMPQRSTLSDEEARKAGSSAGIAVWLAFMVDNLRFVAILPQNAIWKSATYGPNKRAIT
jgi:hypothetical protein